MLKNELESKHDLNRIITVKDELGTIDKLMVSIQNKMVKKAKYSPILIKTCSDSSPASLLEVCPGKATFLTLNFLAMMPSSMSYFVI